MLYSKHGGDAEGQRTPKHRVATKTKETPVESKFDYLLPDLKDEDAARLPGDPSVVTDALVALANEMVERNPADPSLNSTIPTIYTYWGQFIDHDMTANTDRNGHVSDITRLPIVPLDPDVVVDELPNLRRPTFDLDSLYGNGPGLDPDFVCPDPGPPDTWLYDGPKFRTGSNAPIGGDIPPAADLGRDLPRVGALIASGDVDEEDIPEVLRDASNSNTAAAIADARNDENLIVAQFHFAFLRFHNAVVDEILRYPGNFGVADSADDAQVFKAAHRLTRFHYQWLVVNDYLPTITLPGIVDKVLVRGPRFYPKRPKEELFAPLEYSVAAFRFGHSMVRGRYDHNRVFGLPNPLATMNDLFLFTGNGFTPAGVPNPLAGFATLPSNWIIEWDRMTNKVDADSTHFARKIDTHLVPPLADLPNQGNGSAPPVKELLRHLARRNLLRGYLLAIPTGQAVAKEMGVAPLTADELTRDNTVELNAALDAGGFVQHTPLWYYVLKEAEVRANGNCLGELGSRIVAETQIGLLRNDPDSYMHAGWDPSQGVTRDGDPIVTIRDLLHFVGLPA